MHVEDIERKDIMSLGGGQNCDQIHDNPSRQHTHTGTY